MTKGPRRTAYRSSKITHISAARINTRERPPLVEPSQAVAGLWIKSVPEEDRTVIIDSTLRSELNMGDPVRNILARALYVVENAREAYTDDNLATELVCHMARIARDYGEPEGVVVLEKAASLFRTRRDVRIAVTDGLSRIGDDEHLSLMLSLVKSDIDSPNPHFSALSEFTQRYPRKAKDVLEFLNPHAKNLYIAEFCRELRSFPVPN